jgi:hypothetical protein
VNGLLFQTQHLVDRLRLTVSLDLHMADEIGLNLALHAFVRRGTDENLARFRGT